jgi:hypothetical protein
MRINTFKSYRFTADLWTFVRTGDVGGGEVLNYSFARTINLHAASSSANRLFVFFKESEFDAINLCQLYNFKDVNGNEMRLNGVYELATVEPQINLWGAREGFKGVAHFIGTDNS